MRRILLFLTDLEIGGTPTVVRELAIRLRAASDADVQVACLARAGPVAEQLVRAGVRVAAFGARGVRDFPAAVLDLAGLIRRERIDTVLSFLVHANVIAAMAAMMARDVRWLQAIQTTQPTPRWHWRAQALAQHAAERIVVPSPSVARAAVDWADVPEEKIVVIPNAVDLCEASSRREDQTHAGNRTMQSGAQIAHVGFIGRLDPVKRIPDLLAAMAALRIPAHLDIYGEGADRPRIEAAIENLRLRDRVTLHGSIASPWDALQRMNLLVLPSEAEGFGLVLIEAMAAGVPVVAAHVPGIRDVVRDGETGLLVPPGAPAQLAAAIDRVLDDAALRARLIREGLDDVRRRFSWEAVLPKYLSVLALNDRAETRGLLQERLTE